jgi:thymidylate synthase ThyX
MNSFTETFTDAEAAILRRYFTNIDRPVFGLINLPEVVKAALFARYSRTTKSLRRLFLDEFYDDLGFRTSDEGTDVGIERAERLFARVIADYGDDSVAQLGGVHIACEEVSNVLTKILERARLMSYLEQSTRYLDYGTTDANGAFRYCVPDELPADSEVRVRFRLEMDELFGAYNEIRAAVEAMLLDGEDAPERIRALRAASYDAVRGLLPSATRSNVGIFGSVQGFEQLVMRLRASRLAEARHYGEMIRDALMVMVPSMLTRLDRSDRGGVWVDYRRTTAEITERAVRQVVIPSDAQVESPGVVLVDFDRDGEERILAEIVASHTPITLAEARRVAEGLDEEVKDELFRAYVGERLNRRHRPGRAFEAARYDFEVVSDYGAFRDLQRHRMLSIDWQPLGIDLGYDVPDTVASVGMSSRYVAAMERAKGVCDMLSSLDESLVPYGVPMGYRIRFRLSLNAREAMHLIELRSQASGHPSYRRVAQEMHSAIRNIAGHNRVAIAMSYLDGEDYVAGREDAERRTEERKSLL